MTMTDLSRVTAYRVRHGGEWLTVDPRDVEVVTDGPRRYDDVVVHRAAPIISEAPDVTLMSPELFLTLNGHFVRGDLVWVGVTEDGGEDVFYRVAGWDADHRALVVVRAEPPEEDTDG